MLLCTLYRRGHIKYAHIAYCTPPLSSYGAPLGNVISGRGDSAINPRLPGGGSTVYSASGDAPRASALEQNPFIATSASPDDSFTAPQDPNKITLTEPGYG